MRKIISLFFVAVLAIGSFSCKKDPEVNMERIRIHENEKQFSTNGETISMSLSGSVSYSKEISKMTLWLGSKQDLSDAVGYDILLHDTAFSVEVNDLGSDATYYYRYGIYRYSTEFGKEMEIGGMQTNEVSTHNLLYVPKVETGEVLQIMQTSAVVKGTVVNDGGTTIIEKGVCWSTDSIPTIADNCIPSETGEASFSVSITGLSEETTYYVRVYAINEVGVGYGVEKSFTTEGATHEYVDLGLPSGTLWATYNVGANSPKEYGDLFAWGEVQPKDTYSGYNYKYSDGTNYGYNAQLTKYCTNSECGYNGFIDDLIILLHEDDAATVNLGVDWRTPTKEEWQELYQNTTYTWTTQSDVYGMLFTASNGNSLFLPASPTAITSGSYWSSSLHNEHPHKAWDFRIYSNSSCGMENHYRYVGNPIRAVRFSSQNYTINISANPSDGGMVSGGGTYQQGQSCTVNATANNGFSFSSWIENGNVVSTNASYTFMVNGNRSLVANFTTQPQNYTISVSANPTNGGTVSGGGTYQQGQNCTVTATANNGFSFSNWTKNGSVVSSNASYTFAVNANVTLIANFIGVYNGHEYVDLGLPSGLLWATCNVGANSPEDYGDYFAWGETQPKSWYNWNYYQHCQGGEYKLTKYCNNSSVGLSGFVDDLTTLLPEDDAATANWGGDWRMPTKEEFEELYAYTTCTWTSQAGVSGRLFTASNGNSLFLPAAGHRDEGFLTGNGSNGFYWSSSLYADDPYKAWGFFFLSNNYIVSKWGRCEGYSVRAVYTSQDPVLQTIPLAFPQVPPTAVR